ncbi:DEAD/DEAH box helicase [Deminuibacter soli]|uniref:DEAD-box ATP-dependent RNA helicase RhpA n=1 Tax=Deminuibacter soli TaxID=2291815 RepID=A0A3E1NDG8_9BACT|nr:DEAD/DEAH box helicase [Deminuibacter soli]RFM26006.1 ATP-dependent helicase [Deminuibacter soli]
MTFQELQLSDTILRALEQEGYTNPTPIQQKAIPVVLQGRDLLGCAQTGTGKTAAFALPILQLLSQQPRNKSTAPRALVLTPTRELALQIEENFTAYGKHTGLKVCVIFGGVSQQAQVNALRGGVDVLIATPGRLLDFIGQGLLSLAQLQFFVLDEADRMLDMGFIHDIKKIIKILPAKKQTLFFSATMPVQIAGLADSLLQNPVKVEVAPVSSTAEKIEQSVYMVAKNDKPSLLVHLLKELAITRTLVFARTKHGSDKIARHLNKAGVKAEAIHGNKSQNARQRALTNFKNGELTVLVATDIVARGIDVDDLSHVINFDLPEVPETYVHRIGRTGRAQKTGIALSFCDAEERINLRDIHKVTAQQIPVQHEHPFAQSDAEAATIALTLQPVKQPQRGGRQQQRQHQRPKQHQQQRAHGHGQQQGANAGHGESAKRRPQQQQQRQRSQQVSNN